MHDRVMDKSRPFPHKVTSAIARAVDPSHANDRQEPTSRLQRIIGNRGSQRMLETASRQSVPPAAAGAETLPADRTQPDEGDVAFAQRAGDSAPSAATPASAEDGDVAEAEKTASASLVITGDGSYDDQPTTSFKTVTFNTTWKGGSKEDYIIVNWLKGYIKKPDGTPFKVSMYGSLVDFDFSAFQVDSVDEDPAYWSAGGVRWNYTVDAADKFSATDRPGPPSFAKGTKAHVDFKTAVYKSADVPSKTSGSLAATPLSSFQTWTYYMEVTDPGKYTH